MFTINKNIYFVFIAHNIDSCLGGSWSQEFIHSSRLPPAHACLGFAPRSFLGVLLIAPPQLADSNRTWLTHHHAAVLFATEQDNKERPRDHFYRNSDLRISVNQSTDTMESPVVSSLVVYAVTTEVGMKRRMRPSGLLFFFSPRRVSTCTGPQNTM